MIAIIDYGAGNLFSVKNALDYLGYENCITSSVKEIEMADKLILPGVGAFPDTMDILHSSGLTDVIRTQAEKKLFLGICLGMQMLFEKGYEFRECEGLGLISGSVKRIEAGGLKVPHMGWNSLNTNNSCMLMDGVPENSYVYFVHSYCAHTEDKHVAQYAEYGERITALVQRDNIFGAQFHPEKSGDIGLKILNNFCTFK